MEQEIVGWQWHQLDHIQIIFTLLQTDNLINTLSLTPVHHRSVFLQAGCPSCRPTVKTLKANLCATDSYKPCLLFQRILNNMPIML